MIKPAALLFAVLTLSGCNVDSSHPSDAQILDAFANNLQRKGVASDLVDLIRGGEVDAVDCEKETNPTCHFKISSVRHVAVFTKTTDGRWSALSIDGE